jgi:hypothetical protein
MAVTLTGKEFKAFYEDPQVWKDPSSYVDEMQIFVDGKIFDGQRDDGQYVEGHVEDIHDHAQVKVEYGTFCANADAEGEDVCTTIRRWKKAQTTRTLLVEVDVAKLDAFKAAIKAAGGKVLD